MKLHTGFFSQQEGKRNPHRQQHPSWAVRDLPVWLSGKGTADLAVFFFKSFWELEELKTLRRRKNKRNVGELLEKMSR